VSPTDGSGHPLPRTVLMSVSGTQAYAPHFTGSPMAARSATGVQALCVLPESPCSGLQC
jgi:hypothetical protein